jgi:hypothetical protein
VTELKQADKYDKSARLICCFFIYSFGFRKKMCCILLIIIVLLAVIALIVYFSVSKATKK